MNLGRQTTQNNRTESGAALGRSERPLRSTARAALLPVGRVSPGRVAGLTPSLQMLRPAGARPHGRRLQNVLHGAEDRPFTYRSMGEYEAHILEVCDAVVFRRTSKLLPVDGHKAACNTRPLPLDRAAPPRSSFLSSSTSPNVTEARKTRKRNEIE